MAKKRKATGDLEQVWAERAKLLRAMAHPVRLSILEALCDGPMCVYDINSLVDISQPHLSQHIAALRNAALIACHTNGPLRCYYVLRPTLVQKLIPLLRQEHPARQRKRDIVVREAHRPRQVKPETAAASGRKS
jgi:ArsR family transcriptional regulator